jgi:hypothetical protein
MPVSATLELELAVVTFVRSSRLATDLAGSTAVSIAMPAGTADGDVVLVIVHANGASTTIVDNNGATPYTEDLNDVTQTSHTVSVFSRRVVGGDPGTLHFTLGSSQRWTVVAVTIQNPHASVIYDVAPTSSASQPATSINAPNITTLTANALHCAVGLVDGITVAITGTPSGYIVEQNGGHEGLAFTTKTITAAGATGAQAFSAPAANPGMIALSFAIRATSTGWTDITADLIRDPIRWSRGMFGSGPLDRMARPGTLHFTLDNSDQNTAQTEGLYSPGHTDALTGFLRGSRVRLQLTDGIATRYVFRGKLRSILPDPGVTGLRTTSCTALDWLAEFADFDAANLDIYASVGADDLLTALLAVVPTAPANVDLDLGSDTYAFAFDDLGGVTPKAASVAQDILQSEMGYLYLRGDATDGETLRFENRQARAVSDVVEQFTRDQLANEPGAFAVPSEWEDIINDVEVRTVPRRQDAAATTVLIQCDQPIAVDAGATIFIIVEYRDPNNEAEFVGGMDMEPLTVTTDWTANAASNGSGANVAGDFTVTATYFGSRALIELENAGGSIGYVRGPGSVDGLQARGRGVYRYAPVISRGINQDSIDIYGRRQLPESLLMPYQGDQNIGQDVAEFIARLWGGRVFPRRVRLLSEADDNLVTSAITRDVGDMVSFTEATTGISDMGTFINAVECELSLAGQLTTWWTLAPADDSAVMIFDDGAFDENVFGFA